MNETVPELTGYQATAAELRRIADAIEKLPSPRRIPYATMTIIPGGSSSTDEQKIEAVDALALAVLGRVAATDECIPGDCFHIAQGYGNGVYFTAQERLSRKPDPRDDELARLRAEVEQLRAERAPKISDELINATAATWNERESRWDYADTGLDYSRPADSDDPQPTGGREPMHTGGMTDCGLVDETVATVECTPECDALHTPGAPSGLDRGWHDDDCPIVPVLDALHRDAVSES